MKSSVYVTTTLSLAIACLVSGCSTTRTPTNLSIGEKILNTGDSKSSLLFHSTLYYPNEIGLNSEGFIVGLEKSPVESIVTKVDKDIHVKEDKYFGKNIFRAQAKAQDKIIDSKILYISHIMHYYDKSSGDTNCAIYDLYRDISEVEDNKDNIITKPCVKHYSTLENYSTLEKETIKKTDIAKKSYNNSWKALEELESQLAEKIKDNNSKDKQYSHIIVITMGWNTTQEEATRNFNSILNNIREAALSSPGAQKYNPLVIGVTWPSQMDTFIISKKIAKAISFKIKRSDADEVGLTWLGVLLNETIPRANQNKIPVVAIGHSFGARATGTAICFGPVIFQENAGEPKNAPSSKPFVDYFIALQGAFSENRILNSKGADDGVNFYGCPEAKHILMTASQFDTAVSGAVWGSYAGTKNTLLGKPKGLLKYCKNGVSNKSGLQCVKANDEGTVSPTFDPNYHITYVDADALINRNAYLSGGGAHSDIYRLEHGKLIWSYIKQ